MRRPFSLLAGLIFALVLPCLAAAQSLPSYVGQVVYLPIYSHIYHGNLNEQGKPIQTLLSVHVSIRNTNINKPLELLYARYYDTNGKLLKEFVPNLVVIPPLGTHELFVPQSDISGGSGANFLISWSAGTSVNPPLIEALHADIQPTRTLTFITSGRPIHPLK
jgi:hypothetical protein